MAEIMAVRGPTLDDAALTMELRRLGKLGLFEGLGAGSELQGANAVAGIVHGTPGVLDPWQALSDLREQAGLGALRIGLLSALRELDGGESLGGVKAAVMGALGAAEGIGSAEARSLRPALGDEIGRILGPARPRGCPTGSVALDRATGGIRPKDVWCIGAPTSWGKSSYLCTLFRLALLAGLRMLIVSGEDPCDLYSQRILTGLTGVNAWRAREACLLGDERAEISQALTGLPDFPFFLDAIGRSAEGVAGDIRSVITASDVPGKKWIVAVDYIQAFRSAARQQDKRAEIIACARSFTNAIKGSGAAGVLFSQVTRDASGKLKMREADDLIHAAEVGLYGEIEDVTELDHDGRKQRSVRRRSFQVAKIKNGPSGFSAPLSWDDDSATFIENDTALEAAE
jgi:ribosomal protein S11